MCGITLCCGSEGGSMRGRHLLVPLLVAASVVAASLSQAAATPPRAASGAQPSPASGAQPSPASGAQLSSVSERAVGATPSAAASSAAGTGTEPRPPWQVLCTGTGLDGPRIEVVYSRDAN